MSLSDDDRTAPKLSDLTTVDPANPFDSTIRDVGIGSVMGRQTQLSSDPPTAILRRDSFRELPPGAVVGDTYEIDARLGAGAMGEVYAARHVNLGKRVAIKVIRQRLSEDNAAIERFAMEARTLAQIQHPAIVAVEHIGELADGRAFFVMELLRGETLFERLRRGRIALPEALRILDQMARGLEAAHTQGVTHRDLKPENTFLAHLPDEPSIIKLVDFGLAKIHVSDHRVERTQSGVALGTPMYMSPEQARGPDVDHRTDIYSLGCVAYELVLGQAPFPHARTVPELYAAHLHESPPLPRSIWPEIPPQLDLALFAMLAKDPAHRPTLAQVRAVIADARTSSEQRAASELVGLRATKPRRGTAFAIAAVVLVALGGGITIGMAVVNSNVDVPTKLTPKAHTAPALAPTEAPPAKVPEAPPAGVPEALPTKPSVESPSATKPKSSASPPRNISGGSRTPRQTPKADSTTNVPVIPPVIPVGANVNAAESPKPVDRNQTVNPFAKKRPKVNQ